MQPHERKTLKIKYTCSFLPSEKTRVLLWLSKPQNSDTQEIKGFEISHKPTSSYKYRENEILHFELSIDTKTTFEVLIKVILRQKEYDTKNLSLPTNTDPEYLKEEMYLEQPQEIQKIVSEMKKGTPDAVELVKKFFDYIIDNFEYCYPVGKRGVSNLNIGNLSGDCGEYSSLLVSMCRIAGIPARNETGFVVFPDKKGIVEHGWASVNLSPYNWINVDTQWAQLKKQDGESPYVYFLSDPEHRISFTHGFNVPLKPKIPQNYTTEYWDKEGLPSTEENVQTLQPIFFASDKPVQFNSNITC